jgi:hypothetical protein
MCVFVSEQRPGSTTDHRMRLEDCGLPFDACERREERQRPAWAANVDGLINEFGELTRQTQLEVESVAPRGRLAQQIRQQGQY